MCPVPLFLLLVAKPSPAPGPWHACKANWASDPLRAGALVPAPSIYNKLPPPKMWPGDSTAMRPTAGIATPLPCTPLHRGLWDAAGGHGRQGVPGGYPDRSGLLCLLGCRLWDELLSTDSPGPSVSLSDMTPVCADVSRKPRVRQCASAAEHTPTPINMAFRSPDFLFGALSFLSSCLKVSG